MTTKLQHYVPQFYLEGFADPEKPTNIWVYEKGAGDPRWQGIKGTAAETHYYSLDLPDGTKDDVIEHEVLGRVETRAAPVIERWRLEKRPAIGADEVRAVAPFLAVCFSRSPLARKSVDEGMQILARELLREAATNDELLDNFLKTEPDLSKETMLEAIRIAQDPARMTIRPNHNILVGQPLLMADEIVPYITGRRWAILEAPSDIDFITSDCPLSVFELHRDGKAVIGAGIGQPGALVTLPLSPRRALRLSLSETKGYRRLTFSETKEINRRAAAQALRYVFASRRSKRIQSTVAEFDATRDRALIDPSKAHLLFRGIRAREAGRRSDPEPTS